MGFNWRKGGKNMEIRVNVEDEFAQQLQEKLGAKTATQVARVALTLLNWAVDEAAQDRVILSRDRDGNDLHKLVLPSLESVKRVQVQGKVTTSGKVNPRLVPSSTEKTS
jgi:hypothetical protein